MGTDIQVYDDLLKKVIFEKVMPNLSIATPVLDMFNSGVADYTYQNNNIYITNRTGNISTYSFGGLQDILSSQPAFEQMVSPIKSYANAMTISGLAIAQTMSGAGAISSAVTQNAASMYESAAIALDTMSSSYGKGELATIIAAAAVTTSLTVDTSVNLNIGDTIWIGTSAQIFAGAGFDYAQITNINGPTVTVIAVGANPLPTVAIGDVVVKAGACVAGIYNDFSGLANLIDNGVYSSSLQGISRTNGFVNSYGYTISGPISIANMQTTLANTSIYSPNREVPDMIFMEYGVYNSFCALLLALKQTITPTDFTGRTRLRAFTNAVAFDGPAGPIPVYPSWRLPVGTVYMVNSKYLRMGKGLTNGEFGPFSANGSNPVQRIPNQDTYQFIYGMYGNNFITNPRTCGFMKGQS